MQFNFPHTIAGSGEKITVLRTFVKDGVEVLECDIEVQPKAGPPMHTHHRQDESFTIVSGTMAYQTLGEEPKYAYPGDSITIKAGIPHKFWNPGYPECSSTFFNQPLVQLKTLSLLASVQD